jgi:hypothetical protein
LRYFGIVPPEVAEIPFEPVPPAPEFAAPDEQAAPLPGCYAVSVNHLMAYHHFDHDTPSFLYFQQLERAATIGYSLYIYHIGDAEVSLLTKHFESGVARAAE